jgi:tetratricopeptide (TPR) repeat protein
LDITNLEELKKKFSEYKEMILRGQSDKTALLGELLDSVGEQVKERRAGQVDARGNISISKHKDSRGAENKIYISLNHVMEYYLYAYYYKPDCEVLCSELPYSEYYRTYGDLCVKGAKYKAGADAYKNAICWNPVDLDAVLGLAECYKYLNMLERYLIVTKEAYRLCCTRATMARYYRNMGFYFLSKYKPETARACYIYSNIYYHTENADSELAYIESALKQKTPQLAIAEMQKMFDGEGIEPGPSPDTIGVIYRVGEIMMESSDYRLARDCFSIVYDITGEEQLGKLLEELENV